MGINLLVPRSRH